MKKHCTRKRNVGLTLLEALIATLLFSLIILVCYPSLKTIFKSLDRIAIRETPTEEYSVERFFRTRIEQSMSLYRREHSTRERFLIFSGTNDQITSVIPLQDSVDFPGVYKITLRLEDQSDQRWLSFEYSLMRDSSGSESLQSASSTIIEGISEASFSFYDGFKHRWEPQWQDKKSFPKLIKFSFQKNNGENAEWLVPIKAAAPLLDAH